ncbi:hypothetical protein GOP47_0029461 [Adiantum capillus-veneris]|nr:hypothetical protein GOP47_0029461 [Adiantum capillus-veneris]
MQQVSTTLQATYTFLKNKAVSNGDENNVAGSRGTSISMSQKVDTTGNLPIIQTEAATTSENQTKLSNISSVVETTIVCLKNECIEKQGSCIQLVAEYSLVQKETEHIKERHHMAEVRIMDSLPTMTLPFNAKGIT